jgi:hypothetical protein
MPGFHTADFEEVFLDVANAAIAPAARIKKIHMG